MKQVRIFVSGRVQGVGFRASTFHEAKKKKDLRGYVRNLEDGRVEAVFSGPVDDVDSMVSWCRKGPSGSRVEEAQIIDEDLDLSLSSFEIRHSQP